MCLGDLNIDSVKKTAQSEFPTYIVIDHQAKENIQVSTSSALQEIAVCALKLFNAGLKIINKNPAIEKITSTLDDIDGY